jgi:hypothetical protein
VVLFVVSGAAVEETGPSEFGRVALPEPVELQPAKSPLQLRLKLNCPPPVG